MFSMISKIPGIPDISQISGISQLLSSRGTVAVERGSTTSEVIILNPTMTATSCLNFEHDFLWTSSAGNPFYSALTQSVIPKNVNRVATLIEVMILNRSGANDVYTWYLWNANTNETLIEITDTTINNKTSKSWHVVIGADKISEGDTIYFVTYDGVLGTAGTEPILGQYLFTMTALTDTKNFAEWMGVEEI